MKQSEEKIPKTLDYGEIPEKLEKEMGPPTVPVGQESAISYDGRQHLVRFPKKISEIMNIKTGDKVKFNIKMPNPKSHNAPALTMELIKSYKRGTQKKDEGTKED